MKKLYCFDFDGTLTKEDTMFSFLRFYNRRKFFFNFIKHLPFFLMLKLGLSQAERVKKNFIASILKGEHKEKIQRKSILFFKKCYPKILRENALNFIQNIDYTKTECYLVTASLDIWVKPFAEKFGMKLVSTQAKFENGIYTENFASKNCSGAEKVNRIKKSINKQKFDKIIAFGDASGDKEMLTWADESYYRFFH